MKNVEWFSIWYNNVPVGQKVTCYLSPIRALPLVKGRISKPRIMAGGRTMTFPVEIESGCYLEYNSREDCRLYGPKRELLQEVKPEGEAPILDSGENSIVFGCERSAVRPRANVTLITRGGAPLRRWS